MTIRRVHQRLFLFLPVILFSGRMAAQHTDFRTWFETDISKGLSNGIDLSLEVEQRLRNNSLRFDRTLFTIAGDYDINKYIRAAAGVRGLISKNNEGITRGSYRLQADATGRYTLSEIDLTFRMRLQYGFEDISVFDLVQENNLAVRNRLRCSHHIFGTRITLFAMAETWHLLSGKPQRHFRKLRISTGAEYTLNFRSELNLRYILEEEFNVPDPLQAHILVIGYAYSL